MMIELITSQATDTAVRTGVGSGVGIGSIIAVVCSWDRNRSILWAILAAVFSWFYVIYFALTRQPIDVLPEQPPFDMTNPEDRER